MSQFIVSLVAAIKAFNKLSQYVDDFISEWIKYDVAKIGGVAEAKKQEFDALESAMKRTANDTERLALLRALDRTRELPDLPRPELAHR
jgi:hypothetical protein